MHDRDDNGYVGGHSCRGGGATIKNSPINHNVTINIYVGEDATGLSLLQQIGTTLGVRDGTRKIGQIEVTGPVAREIIQGGELCRCVD